MGQVSSFALAAATANANQTTGNPEAQDTNPIEIVQHCANVLQSELAFGWIFNGLAVVAFVVAILLLQQRGLVALQKLENAAGAVEDDPVARKGLSGMDFKSFAEGLKALAEALRNAPAGVTLFIVAIGVFYIPAANVGSPCDDILTSKAAAEAEQDRLKALMEEDPSSVTITNKATNTIMKADWKRAAKGEGST